MRGISRGSAGFGPLNPDLTEDPAAEGVGEIEGGAEEDGEGLQEEDSAKYIDALVDTMVAEISLSSEDSDQYIETLVDDMVLSLTIHVQEDDSLSVSMSLAED